jgi:hypothetical protein
MSLNPQTPQLFTVGSSDTLTITNARAISVLASGGTATIENAASQTMTIPDATTLEMQGDSSNTLTQIVVTAANTAYVVIIGGNGLIS